MLIYQEWVGEHEKRKVFGIKTFIAMKHKIIKALSFVSLFAVFACSEDVVVENNLSNGVINEISITGTDFMSADGTRSSVSIGEKGANFAWSENDTIGIFPNQGSQAEFAMSEGAGTQTATFSGGGWALKASATYSAYYPYDFYNRDMTKIPVSYAGQTQNGNNNTDHIGAYDFMAASVATPSNGAVSFAMQHMGALVMLQTDLDEAKTLTSVTLSAEDAEFTTTGTMDLTAATPVISSLTTSETLTIPLTNFQVAEDETTAIYFMLSPINLSGKTVSITLSDEDGRYIEFEVQGKDFLSGTAYAYTLVDGEKCATSITYNAVDLGLPSGTLWADRNVGADSPEAYGDYFAWGETSPKSIYYFGNYKWYQGDFSTQTKYSTDSSFGTVDNKTTLDLEDDAAYVNMGEEWRMPTDAEQEELMSECTWTWTTQNGTTGYKVTGPNSNSIFLPAAGYRSDGNLYNEGAYGEYWSSSFDESYPNDAWNICFNYNYRDVVGSGRCCGRSVRAVVR